MKPFLKGGKLARRPTSALLLAGAIAALGITGCDGSGGVGPPNGRFGQVGEIRVHVITPLALGIGELQQVLTWRSNGAWQFLESVAYRNLVGDEHLVRSQGDPNAFASAYASFITQLNEVQALKLFIEDLDPELDPSCGTSDSRVSFEIRDDTRDESAHWVRCGNGSLATLLPGSAGPDPAASRVIVDATLARDFTLGEDFVSVYNGTAPFGTLDRGENSELPLERSRAFVGDGSGATPEGWLVFWAEHRGSVAGTPPEVDWASEMVLVGAVGERFEAGDSVEVRRVLPATSVALVEIFERIPGNFCSPAARTHTPFHIVVTPRTPLTIQFSDPRVEEVDCGF